MLEPTISRRQLGRSGLSAAVVIAAGVSGCTSTPATPRLVCRHQRTDEVYADLPLVTDMQIGLSWVHSIELSRWTETYRPAEDGLLLVSTRFKTYGAGMPLDEGTVRHEDGWIVIDDINRPLDAIRWVNSHRVDYRISIDGDETLVDALSLPDREPLELRPV